MARPIHTFSIGASDTSTDWVKLNSNIEGAEDSMPRSFSGALTTGDTITIELTNDTDPNNTLETRYPSDGFTDNNFGGVLDGHWSWIRVLKTGTTGAATVKVRL